MEQILRFFILFVCLIFVIGCSGGTNAIHTDKVEGTITFEGQPLAGATVNFSPATAGQGEPSYAQTDENGHYKLQTLLGKPDAGTIPGDYIVTVLKTESVPTGKQEKGPDMQMYDVVKSQSVIPESYGDKAKSPFKAAVVSGKNQFDFALKKDGT
ncbi:MAG: YbfJ family protein [Planctomycetaceae bacterium]|jgi:hypothetical protein|nr:YbfJ family protein [Planctomycetaceae bacterium]